MALGGGMAQDVMTKLAERMILADSYFALHVPFDLRGIPSQPRMGARSRNPFSWTMDTSKRSY
jgi:hypothetical protein